MAAKALDHGHHMSTPQSSPQKGGWRGAAWWKRSHCCRRVKKHAEASATGCCCAPHNCGWLAMETMERSNPRRLSALGWLACDSGPEGGPQRPLWRGGMVEGEKDAWARAASNLVRQGRGGSRCQDCSHPRPYLSPSLLFNTRAPP